MSAIVVIAVLALVAYLWPRLGETVVGFIAKVSAAIVVAFQVVGAGLVVVIGLLFLGAMADGCEEQPCTEATGDCPTTTTTQPP